MTNYRFRVLSFRVIDGDTLEATLDLGFRATITEQFRLARINAPELPTPEGKVAKEMLSRQCTGTAVLTIESHKTEKWRRWLAELYSGDTNVNDWLVEQGYAVKYEG